MHSTSREVQSKTTIPTFVVNHQIKQKQLNISVEVILLFAIKEMHFDFILLHLFRG